MSDRSDWSDVSDTSDTSDSARKRKKIRKRKRCGRESSDVFQVRQFQTKTFRQKIAIMTSKIRNARNPVALVA
jgi:hypothetical protein